VRGFWAVLRREFAERRLLLLGAAMVGLFPLLIPLLPGVAGRDSSEMRGGTAVALCLIIGGVLSLALGASVIAGDLSERRLGFYFARPIAGWAIWAGKLAGAAALAVSAEVLVLLPTLAIDRRLDLGTPWWPGGDAWIRNVPLLVLALTAGCVMVLLLSHVLSSMARSRSPWLLLDLGAALAVTATVWSARQVLLREQAFDAFALGLCWLAAAVLATASVAGAVQVTRGRTDSRRAHRLLSLTFWSGLGTASLAFAAYSHWVVTVAPRDLRSIAGVLSPPAGTWVGLQGRAAKRGDYYPAFLFDAASGRSVKIGGSQYFYWWQQPVFAPDGSRAAWVEPGFAAYDLKLLDLTRPGARPTATAVSFAEWPRRMALSPGGKLFAAFHRSSLTLDDLASGRLLAAAPFTAEFDRDLRLLFSETGRLRVYHDVVDRIPTGGATWKLTAYEIDPSQRRLIQIGGVTVPGEWQDWSLSRDGERVALRTRGGPVRLADLRTGTILATLPSAAEQVLATFLADGRLLLDERTLSSTMLRLFDVRGTELRRFSFPSRRVAVGGEVEPGRLAVATADRGLPGSTRGWISFLLDLDSGRTAAVGRDLVPAGRGGSPRSIGPRLFLHGRELVLLDPASGRLRTLLRTAK